MVRADIQGLRAIAVLLVLAFHLWPDRIPGGFVGVDVFLVVSGFLITGHLARTPPRRPADVVRFWGRRVRRLLPASLLVIVATVIAGVAIFPATRLVQLVTDALASTFYVENWRLAASSVDYLAARVPASPLQHYWSLGVEEQFYLLWPVLIGLLALRRSRLLVPGIIAVLVVSLAVSVVWTSAEPSTAFFATPTRLWEFAAGGLIGILTPVLPAWSGRARALIAWAGILVIAVSAFAISGDTPFPGIAALLPVAGTVLVLGAASADGRASPTFLLRRRPVQWIGDASYSIYLWHFPLIVFGTFVLGGELPTWAKIAIAVATLALAALSRVLIENPPRRSAWLRPSLRTFGLAALATVAVVAVSLAPTLRVAALDEQAASQRTQVEQANAGCLGAEALATAGCAVTVGAGTIPSPTRALDDFSVAYSDGCLATAPFRDVVTCEYGETGHPALRVALVGNSHGAQWLPALQQLAGERELEITTYLAVGCMPTTVTVVLDTPAASAGCLDWGARVTRAVAEGGYDLVIVTAASVFDIEGVTDPYVAQVEGYSAVLSAWSELPVLVIRDSPFPGFDVPDCVASRGAGECEGDRSEWAPPDPLAQAAEDAARPGLSVVDLDDLFCSADTCYPVIGGVLVYVDYSHFGATFSRTLAPFLAPALDAALAR